MTHNDTAKTSVSESRTSKRNSPWLKRGDREAERQQKRQAILQTSVELFNKNGFDATSLDQVAELLNVTKPTIYNYFTDKKQILFECLDQGLDDFRSVFQSALKIPTPGIEQLTLVMERYGEVMMSDFGRCVVRMNDRDLSAENRKVIRQKKKQNAEFMRRLISGGMEDGSIAKGDVRLTAIAVAGALNSIALWYESGSEPQSRAAAKAIIQVLLKGLQPRA